MKAFAFITSRYTSWNRTSSSGGQGAGFRVPIEPPDGNTSGGRSVSFIFPLTSPTDGHGETGGESSSIPGLLAYPYPALRTTSLPLDNLSIPLPNDAERKALPICSHCARTTDNIKKQYP